MPVTVPLIQNLGIEIQRAKNKYKTRSVVYLVISMLNIAFSIPLVKMYGPVGAAIGTALSLVAGNIVFMNWYYHYRIGLDMVIFWKNIFSLVPAMIVPLVFGVCIRVLIHPVSIMQVTVAGVAYGIVFGIFMFKFGMNEYEKGIVTGVLSRLRNK